MEFALSQDQMLLQDSVRQALQRACPLDRVRALSEAANASDPGLWPLACELGLPAMLVPEAHGGMGLSLLDAVLVAEELGRKVAPVPFMGTSVLATLAIAGSPDAEVRSQWLPRLATGEVRIGVALSEALSGARDGAGIRVGRQGLEGQALFVIDGEQADAFLAAGVDGGLYLVQADAPGLVCSVLDSVDITRPLCKLSLDRVEATCVSAPGSPLLDTLRVAAWVLQAADILGAGWAMIDQSVAYSRDRQQFGRAIGSFQAVKHLCAEMATDLEIKRGLVWYAAYAFDEKPEDAMLHAAHAKALLSDAGHFVARTATEVHGGIGITDELGLHHWFKRIAMDRQLYGDARLARRYAARLQGLAA